MPAFSRPTDARSPCGGAATTTGWVSRTRSPSCVCSADFPSRRPLEISTGRSILRFAALQVGADAETIHAYARRQQTVSEHQQRIGEYLRLGAFDAAAGERLTRFLEDEALRLERTASLLARARTWLRDEHVLAPADSVLRRAVGAARHQARALLTDRMADRPSRRCVRNARLDCWGGARPPRGRSDPARRLTRQGSVLGEDCSQAFDT